MMFYDPSLDIVSVRVSFRLAQSPRTHVFACRRHMHAAVATHIGANEQFAKFIHVLCLTMLGLGWHCWHSSASRNVSRRLFLLFRISEGIRSSLNFTRRHLRMKE